ncbi:MAG TPA: hypothetical protein VNR87_01340 [Flavisolibacter sp.]|nr:hypothetical protein [Flavisolibacter sp.]
MSYPAAKTLRHFIFTFAASAFMLFFYSCTTIRNYPVNKPFVYQMPNINVEGKYSTDEKKQLIASLEQQLHDSVRVRSQRKFLFWRTIQNPPVFDTLNVEKSRIYMSALLNSMGYYRDSISADTTLNIEGDQYRTTINFNVIPGKLVTVDSVWYNMRDTTANRDETDTIQALTMQSRQDQMVHRGDPFSKPLISSELDRLSDVYRNNGFLRFSRDQLLAVWDTVGTNFLRFTTDPAEQVRQLEELRRRRENPTASFPQLT